MSDLNMSKSILQGSKSRAAVIVFENKTYFLYFMVFLEGF